MFNARLNSLEIAGVVMSKSFSVDGKRPGDEFRRGRTNYRVTRVYRANNGAARFQTMSEHGREVWF